MTKHFMHYMAEQLGGEASGYSCNGVNLYGDKKSIKAACDAFHYQAEYKIWMKYYRKQNEELLETIKRLEKINDELMALSECNDA